MAIESLLIPLNRIISDVRCRQRHMRAFTQTSLTASMICLMTMTSRDTSLVRGISVAYDFNRFVAVLLACSLSFSVIYRLCNIIYDRLINYAIRVCSSI